MVTATYTLTTTRSHTTISSNGSSAMRGLQLVPYLFGSEHPSRLPVLSALPLTKGLLVMAPLVAGGLAATGFYLVRRKRARTPPTPTQVP